MILRGSQLSDSRQVLPLGSPVAQPDAKAGSKLVQVFAMSTGSNSPAATEASTPPVVVTREVAAPTFESVVAWLAVQDAETRHGCASILAAEVAQIYEQAKTEGAAHGKKAAETAAQNALDAWLSKLNAISRAAEQALQEQSARLEAQCVEVISETIAKIAGPLLATEDAAIGAVREILKRVREGREITIRVAREDVDAIKRWQGSLSEALGGHALQIVADSRVELGGALVETKLGSLDGRFEVQLRELYETLRVAKSALGANKEGV